MRLRIETTPPLPPLKTWLNVTSGLFRLFGGKRTVNDLHRRLVSEFGLPEGIKLQFGGYDLYRGDPLESLLNDNDLVKYIP